MVQHQTQHGRHEIDRHGPLLANQLQEPASVEAWLGVGRRPAIEGQHQNAKVAAGPREGQGVKGGGGAIKLQARLGAAQKIRMRDHHALDLACCSRRAQDFGVGLGIQARLVRQGAQIARHGVGGPDLVQLDLIEDAGRVGDGEARLDQGGVIGDFGRRQTGIDRNGDAARAQGRKDGDSHLDGVLVADGQKDPIAGL